MSRKQSRRAVLLCAAAGAFCALGHAPASLPLVSLAALMLGLLAVSRSSGARSAALRGWVFAFAYFLVTLHWIVEPFLVDVARHGWLAPFALVLLPGGLALFWALAAWIAVRLFPGFGARRIFGLALAVFFAEIARAYVFTGFPWAMPGYIWVNLPFASLASLAGVHGLTLATLLAAALGAATLVPDASAPARGAALGCLALLLGLGWFAGVMLRSNPVDARSADRPLVRIVQPNAAQHLKWQPEQIPVFWERKLALTASDAPRRPDLTVWPEVTLPYLLGSRPWADQEIVAAADGVPVLVGAQRFEGKELRNAVAVLAPDGEIGPVYDKQHLVPFGEYFPGGRLAGWLGLEGLATAALGGFTPGDGENVLDLRPIGLGRVLVLICYEAIFARQAHVAGPRPDWIVQSTNDAWFGNFAGPQQHLDHARMRAIEQGLPLLRAANTGISALIDPDGRIVARIDLNVEGVVDVALPEPRAKTLYATTGSMPVFLAAILAFFVLCSSRLLKPD